MTDKKHFTWYNLSSPVLGLMLDMSDRSNKCDFGEVSIPGAMMCYIDHAFEFSDAVRWAQVTISVKATPSKIMIQCHGSDKIDPLGWQSYEVSDIATEYFSREDRANR